MTQCDRVLQYMNDFGSITRLEAMKDLGIANLTARISDLRQTGHRIKGTDQKGKNRYGEDTHWTVYSIEVS